MSVNLFSNLFILGVFVITAKLEYYSNLLQYTYYTPVVHDVKYILHIQKPYNCMLALYLCSSEYHLLPYLDLVGIMATMEDRLLGEKLHYYCSSSEGEDEEEEDEEKKLGEEDYDLEKAKQTQADKIESKAWQEVSGKSVTLSNVCLRCALDVLVGTSFVVSR